MSDYRLSASLEGHDDDVRGVSFVDSKTIISASRDFSVRLWTKSKDESHFEATITSTGSAFVNTVTYIPSSSDYPDGLIAAGGKDSIVEIKTLKSSSETHAERLLIGHAHTVCSLDVSPDGKWIVSGSWDGTARVWSVGKWECVAELTEHEGAAWDVLAYDSQTIITACADKKIRIYSVSGKLQHTIQGGTDVVRALCKLGKGHSSGADFASAGNDGVIRLWELRGRRPLAELYGHENFIYSIASLPDGGLVSCSEDRTAKIWQGTQCIQTITHPAISVWCVSTCKQNGDIVTGASDNIIRVFSKDPARQATAEVIQAFEESVKGSAIPQQQVRDINKEKLIARADLPQRAGKHDGHIIMAREDDGSVTAHSWSFGEQRWVEVGTVVDATTSGKKVGYNGREYDYVFDVDIEDGKPPLKLPYNVTQNPYEAATKFVNDNELPIGYLDQVVQFINTNTRGATIGETSSAAPVGADPWGQESRYRPGGQSPSIQSAPQTPATAPKPSLPQQEYLTIVTANLKVVVKKLEELNQGFVTDRKDIALDSTQVDSVKELAAQLEKSPAQLPASQEVLSQQVMSILLQIISKWPPASRLPALDLLRILVAASNSAAGYGTSSSTSGASPTIVDVFNDAGIGSDKALPNHSMLAARALANMFAQKGGHLGANERFDEIQQFARPLLSDKSNRNLGVALATLYINYAVLFSSPQERDVPRTQERGVELIKDLSTLLQTWNDSEVVYRSLVAIGTLLYISSGVAATAKSSTGAAAQVKAAGSSSKEPRIKRIVGEIEEHLALV